MTPKGSKKYIQITNFDFGMKKIVKVLMKGKFKCYFLQTLSSAFDVSKAATKI